MNDENKTPPAAEQEMPAAVEEVVPAEDAGALAAEYVLGSLDAEERARATALLESEPGFRDMVRLWERRLGELHLMVEPVDPPGDVWDRLKVKMEAIAPSPPPALLEAQPAAPVPAEPELTLDALEAELRMAGLQPPDPKPERPPETVVRAPPREKVVPHHERETPSHTDRALRRWRLAAVLMTLVAVTFGSVMAAWRYAPDRLPLRLQPVQFLNLPEAAPVPRRPVAPPESRFDE
jgi:anti-sigma-K factor RskA